MGVYLQSLEVWLGCLCGVLVFFLCGGGGEGGGGQVFVGFGFVF